MTDERARQGGAPRVSVVIPTYNRAADLARCLNSLVAQTFRDFEVLVCDDGSKDNSAEVVERYKGRLDVSYHWAPNFGGPARPRNEGTRLARAPYVALLDSDDWWAPRKLEISVQHLDAGADLVYHEMFLVRSADQKRFRRTSYTRHMSSPVFDDMMNHGNSIATSSVVVRRELLVRIGGFSEERNLIAWEDFDAWLRIARLTERFVRAPEPLGYYWMGGGNISTAARVIDNLTVFREKYGRREPGAAEIRMPPWYHYSLGRAHYNLGAHAVVTTQMRQALAEGLPGLFRAKAAFFLFMSSLRLMTGAR